MSRLKSVKLKADLSLYNQGKTCSDCRHFIDKDIYGYHCKLTSLILKGIPCQFFNREITGLKVCYNCKHFLSNAGDWGLCCDANYYQLCEALDRPCEEFYPIKHSKIS